MVCSIDLRLENRMKSCQFNRIKCAIDVCFVLVVLTWPSERGERVHGWRDAKARARARARAKD
jgi:hypothetical protein